MDDSSPDHSVWNAQAALAKVDGYEEDLDDLLKIWLRQAPKLLSEMQHALSTGDSSKLQFSAHTLKGSLQILGADVAIVAAAALEEVGRLGQMTHVARLLTELEANLAMLIPQVTAYLNRRGQS